MPVARGLAIGVAMSLAVSGCSFVFAEGPPINHRVADDFDCTSSYSTPNADVEFAFLHLLILGRDSRTGDIDPALVGVTITSAVVHALAATYGYRQVAACRKAEAELGMRLADPRWPFLGVSRAPPLNAAPPGAPEAEGPSP